MKRNILVILSILIASIASRAQHDTRDVIQEDSVIWQHAISEIDSIIFYDADVVPDTNTLPKITGFHLNTFIDENL